MTAARKQSAANIYHVMLRGINKQIIFEDNQDYHVFLKILAENLNEEAELLAYCLMTNHVHLLLRAPIETVSRSMQNISFKYARYFNSRYERVGHLFQDRFQSEPIHTVLSLMRVMCYIHFNPVKAGYAKMENYRWSSFTEYLGAPGFCATDYAMRFFKEPDAFIKVHKHYEETAIRCIDESNEPDKSTCSDKQAKEKYIKILADFNASGIELLDQERRDEVLNRMRRAGMSERQIGRLTGVGRKIIHRVCEGR